VAALAAAHLGLKTVVIEKDKAGGVCTNRGCIPSKALLYAAGAYLDLKNLESFGLKVDNARIDIETLRKRKERVILRMVKSIEFLFRENGIDLVKGAGKFTAADRLTVTGDDGLTHEIAAKNYIVATGSSPIILPGLEPDGSQVITYNEALNLPRVPKKMLVIGGGAIGLEMAEVYAALGSEIIIVELLPTLLPGMDADLCAAIETALSKRKMTIRTGAKVTKIDGRGTDALTVTVNAADDSSTEQVICDCVLVSIGMKPNTAGLGLAEIGVKMDRRGFVEVDNQMKTSVPGIFAIGDIVGGKLLAHKASREGHVCAEVIAGHNVSMDYTSLPGAVFTHPELASVGLTEKDAREKYGDAKIGKFSLQGIGKAVATGHGDGFAKIIAHPQTDQILGAHLVGPGAGDIIGELALAIRLHATATDIGSTIHVHPTISEAVLEAALDAGGMAVHAVKK
jgi:dihydrolipoamide dehydrogenase